MAACCAISGQSGESDLVNSSASISRTYDGIRHLVLLFASWALSRFVLLANFLSKRWTGLAPPGALYVVTLAFSIGSLLIYGSVAFGRSAMSL